MSIDEAIKELTESYNIWMGLVCDDVLEEGGHKVNHCEKNANYCYQLIQWLEELKSYQQLDLDIPQHFTKEQSDWIKKYCINRNKEFYNKAIDDFLQELINYGVLGLKDSTQWRKIHDIASQVRESGKNDSSL